ncbi:MAG: hypothetical protein ACQUHE_05370, partial [Bacteroidia bacterium]
MEDIIWNCMIKRFAGEETEVSKAILNAWLLEDVSHIEKYNEVKQLWELVPIIPRDKNRNSLQFSDFPVIEDKAIKSKKITRIPYYKLGVAASLVATLLLATYYYVQK